MKIIGALGLALVTLLASGCGGSGASSVAPPQPVASVTPASSLSPTPTPGSLSPSPTPSPSPSPTPSPSPHPTLAAEFSVPSISTESLSSIAQGADGAMWITQYNGSAIARVSSAGATTIYPLPAPSSYPTSIVRGPDGNMWFLEVGNRRIGRISPAGSIVEYPPLAKLPIGITSGRDGRMYFTEQDVNAPSIGRIDPALAGGGLTEFAVGAQPEAIITGPDGNLWYIDTETSALGSSVVAVSTQGTQIGKWVLCCTFQPFQRELTSLVTGADGNVWVASRNGLWRITPGGAATAVSGGAGTGITAGADGNIWLSNWALPNSELMRVTPAGQLNTFDYFSRGATNLVVGGPNRTLWFTEGTSVGVVQL